MMDLENATAADLMSSPVRTVSERTRLEQAEELMRAEGLSALGVVDSRGRLAGVISRTDILREARAQVAGGTREYVLSLPTGPVRQYMQPRLDVVSHSTPVREAAQRMVRHRHHRLFVADDGKPFGVLGTTEMMRGVALARITVPIADVMTSSVVTVRVDDPVVLAVDRMAASHRRSLIVVDEKGWPVGVFSQPEALAARSAPTEAPVEDWMDPKVFCLPAEMTADRAARLALAMGARRVVAVSETAIRGVVGGMDFTQLVADAPGG